MPSIYTTQRDVKVLTDLASYRFLSRPQIARLHFPSERAAAERVRRLAAAGLLHRIAPPVRSSLMLRTRVYALTRSGSELLAARTGIERPPHLTPRERRSALFIEHTLRRNDVRIALEILARQGLIQLGLWRQSPKEVAVTTELGSGRKRKKVTVVPDGLFVLVDGSRCMAFLLEVDLGTVPLARMRERYAAYWRLWKDGRHRAIVGDAPLRVLTIANSARRAENLRKVALDAPDSRKRGSRLLWFSSFEQMDLTDAQNFNGSHWTPATVQAQDPEPLFTVTL